jgi:hypothetical protein
MRGSLCTRYAIPGGTFMVKLKADVPKFSLEVSKPRVRLGLKVIKAIEAWQPISQPLYQ